MDTFEQIKSKLTVNNIIGYIIQGVAIALAAYVIPNKKIIFHEVMVISIIGALTFFALDVFAEDAYTGARFGSGFAIAMNLVNSAPTHLPLFGL